MFILPTELSLFNYDKVKSVLLSVTPLMSLPSMTPPHTHTHRPRRNLPDFASQMLAGMPPSVIWFRIDRTIK